VIDSAGQDVVELCSFDEPSHATVFAAVSTAEEATKKAYECQLVLRALRMRPAS
jgi:hypothetical protein